VTKLFECRCPFTPSQGRSCKLTPLMPNRFLITGGAGFIGSHLAERLLGQGHTVVVLDDLSTGAEGNLRHLLANQRLQLVRDSVENEATVKTLIASVDGVFHLASAVGVQLIVDQPVRTIRTTIHGTEVVLEAAYRFNRPVLITSSSEVYGKGTRVPFSESDDVVMGSTDQSRWCYAYSKGIDEFLGLAYHRQYGLPVTIVRLFNTVGPRQVGQYGMVLPRFVEAALRGQHLKITGDGTQTRCFCHVSDVVDAIHRLFEFPGAAGQVFNVGANEEVSIVDLARRVIQITGSSSPLEFISYEQFYGRNFDDMMRRVPDLTKIHKAIGFTPRLSLDQIITSVADSLRTAI
jgi:UDP-glucose 4-epimerase